MSDHNGTSMLCSIFSRQEDEKIIGSARDVKRFLFMELGKPWSESALETDHIPDAVTRAYDNACDQGTFDGKFLPIAPDSEYSRDGYVRFLDFRRPDEAFSRYDAASYLIPEQELGEAAHILLVDHERLDELDPFRESDAPEQEIMVCTHMERDPCCGHFGPPIHQALRTHFDGDDLRTWQVSHVGGHRYCPNLISLPDGRYWGRMELAQLDNFVNHAGEFADLSEQYRGWAALSPPEQIVEKAAFEREGWPWMNYRKTSSLTEMDSDDKQFRVTIPYESDGASGTYEGIVTLSEPVRALKSECGSDTDQPAFKSAPQYELVDLTHTT
jgi:hypothetical protein